MKLFLAVDSYSFYSEGGHNNNSYTISDNKLVSLKNLDNTLIKYFNIENYVGGGESMDYDLIKLDDSISPFLLSQEQSEENITNIISFNPNDLPNDFSIEDFKSFIKNNLQKENYTSTFIFKEDFIPETSLEELISNTNENDFAFRFFEEKGISLIKNFLSI